MSPDEWAEYKNHFELCRCGVHDDFCECVCSNCLRRNCERLDADTKHERMCNTLRKLTDLGIDAEALIDLILLRLEKRK